MSEIHTHRLDGCAPIPLANYLKALGVLRLVSSPENNVKGEAADPAARGWWANERFYLRTRLDRDELLRFFLEDYAPSPIIAPWNGGSGFFPNDNKLGIGPIAEATAERFSAYREAIKEAQSILERNKIAKKPDGVQKDSIRIELRSKLKDCALLWYDAVTLFAQDGFLATPLLGSGGNDGRTDFSNNFMCRLTDLFDTNTGRPSERAEQSLETALFETLSQSLMGVSEVEINGSPKKKLLAIGQFSPGASGGANATVGFKRDTLINPWDYVLLMEGTLLFAASATRRLGSANSVRLSYPFTVYSSATEGTSGSLVDEKRKSKGKFVGASFEMWMPLWERPASLTEIRILLSEGRATLGRQLVNDTIDFARAVATLGVNRGITAFERFAFLQRRGEALSATPKGRIRVEPRAKARLLNDLDAGHWLVRFRQHARELDAQGKNFVAPHHLQTLALRLDEAILAMTKDDAPQVIQRVLIAVGEVMNYFAKSAAARDPEKGNQRPLPLLRREWVIDAADDTPEFRIAAALASLGWSEQQIADSDSNTNAETSDDAAEANSQVRTGDSRGALADWRSDAPKTTPPMAAHFAPVVEETIARRIRQWADRDPPTVVWGSGNLVRNMIAVLDRRLIEQARRGLDDKPLAGSTTADLAAIAAFLEGPPAFDDARCAALLAGLVWAQPAWLAPRKSPSGGTIPFAYAALKPLFTPDAHLRVGPKSQPESRQCLSEGTALPIPPGLLARLRRGEIGEAVREAMRRAHASGIRSPFQTARSFAASVDPARLAAALLIPIDEFALTYLMQRAYPFDERQEETDDAA